jgi:uncharacterized membrane protein YphA (DoxX/SURF4 family)
MSAALWVLRIALGGLFIYAGIGKLADPTQFAIDITNYRIVPSLAPWAAVLLPYVEIGCGIAAIVLPRHWRRAGALAIAGMMALFTVAVSAALARGINIDCGCFGGAAGPITAITVVRDVALFGVALALVLLDREPRSV